MFQWLLRQRPEINLEMSKFDLFIYEVSRINGKVLVKMKTCHVIPNLNFKTSFV